MGAIAMIFVALMIMPGANKDFNEKCAKEVKEGTSSSIRECRQYYIKKKA